MTNPMRPISALLGFFPVFMGLATGCQPRILDESGLAEVSEVDPALLRIDPSRSSLTAAKTTLVASESTLLTVRLFGTDGRPWTEIPAIELALNDPGYGAIGPVTGNGEGVFQATFTGLRAGVLIEISAKVNGTVLASLPAVVTVAAPLPATSIAWAAGLSPLTNQTSLDARWTPSGSSNIVSQQVRYFSGADCAPPLSTIMIADPADQEDTLSASNGNTYSFKVASVDSAGNLTLSACSAAVTVDTQAPTLAISAPVAGTFINIANNSASFPVSGSCSESGRTVQLTLGGANAGTAVCGGGSFSGTIDTTGLGQGAVSLGATLSDAAGNIGTASTVALTKDTVAPSITGIAPLNDTVPAASKTWNWGCSEVCGYLHTLDNTADTVPSGTFGATASATQSAGTGTYYLHVQARDSAGNVSSIVHASAILDNSGPGNPTLTIAAGANTTQSSSVNLTLSASNSPTEMYITNTPGCGSGGSWEPYATSKPGWTLGQTNATATVYAKFRDALSHESGCTSDTILHDNLAPALTFTSPAADTAGATGLTLAGTCEAGLTVNLSGTGLSSPASTSCADGTFSQAITFTAGDGVKDIVLSQTDGAGNTGSANRNFTKDATGPDSPQVLIAGDAASTGSASVSLSLSASGAPAEMYITNTPGCASGGSWEPYATSKAGWSLGQANATATVYAKFRDALGNASACASDTILHDDQAPVLTFTAPAADTAAISGVTITGSCEAGLTVALSGSGLDSPASTACPAGSFSQAITFTAGDGAKDIIVSQTDAAGNSGTTTRRFAKDATGPESPLISINGAASVTKDSTVTLTLSATGTPTQMYITNTAGCADGGVWETYGTTALNWPLAQSNATATVYVKFRDALGNVSSCASDTITHDGQAPALAFTAPAASATANGGVTISGSCEAGLAVSLSGTGLDSPASTTCPAGTFNQAITFTAGEGTKNIILSQTDAAGNTGSANRDFINDTTGPSSPSISIAGGAASTASTTVNLTLSAAGSPTQMYITNVAGCGSGGAWEAYSTSKTGWTLGQSSGTATVYAKFIDAAGNESACANDTIDVTVSSCTPGSQVFTTGDNQTFTVPTNCTSITVKAWGGGGGSSGEFSCWYDGGGGGYVSATLSVTEGENLKIRVGFPQGGFGSCGYACGGNGGGSSSVLRGTTVLLEAGGGGGASGPQEGIAGGGASACSGGNQAGQNGAGEGGGGGAGYCAGLSGMGGTSYGPAGATLIAGSGPNPGNFADPDWAAGVGLGGTCGGAEGGGPARIVIRW